MRWNKLENEACSVARTVSVIGDRWTLLILRDCFLRVRRFEEFQARLGVTRPILASRLRKLVKDFVLAKVPYQERPLRYEYRLTQKGLDLYPIVMSIVHWGDVHMAGKKGRPLLHQHVELRQDLRPGDDLLGMRRAAQPQAGPCPSWAGCGESAPPAAPTRRPTPRQRRPARSSRTSVGNPLARPALNESTLVSVVFKLTKSNAETPDTRTRRPARRRRRCHRRRRGPTLRRRRSCRSASRDATRPRPDADRRGRGRRRHACVPSASTPARRARSRPCSPRSSATSGP